MAEYHQQQVNLFIYKIDDGVEHSVKYRKMPKVYILEIGGDHEIQNFNYFSIVSKRVLEERQDIDIIALINHDRKTIELRTNKENINVGDIAILNGGGGHQKASGFPIV